MASKKGAIAQIISDQWDNIIARCNTYQIRVLHAIKSCRTATLGGQLYLCNKCHKNHVRYNSCGNRHCPGCQNTERLKWIDDRQNQFIETKYFHVVFTIPDSLNALCLSNQRVMYKILFQCAWETLNGFGWNKKFLGAQIGATMVLHTWGSNLSYHPHVHCIVPGGGISIKNKWKQANGKGKYLFPVKAMSTVFREKFKDALKQVGLKRNCRVQKKAFEKEWVVYAKPAFGNKEILIKYLARYTYKTAITSSRIKQYDKYQVRFSYTDYKHRNQGKTMSLSTWEFARRFTMHILPKGFIRIRHFGILHSSWKMKLFPTSKKSSKDYKTIWLEKGFDVDQCPNCKKGKLVFIGEIQPTRGPPNNTSNYENRHSL